MLPTNEIKRTDHRNTYNFRANVSSDTETNICSVYRPRR